MPDNSSFGQVLCTARIVPARRRAFTLVELLIVIIILAILGSIIMFAMFSSQEAARAAKTRNMIAKLNALIMPKYESYMTRRVPIQRLANELTADFARQKLFGLRDLMRMEMPERWSDLEDIAPSIQTASFPSQVSRIRRIPVTARTYWRRIIASHNSVAAREADDFQAAECLYLIVSLGLDDPDAISQFSENEIGDIDGDRLKEFIDGWGRPISFLRWPAGFGARQTNESPLPAPVLDAFSPLQTRNREKDFDQFNSRKIDDIPAHLSIPSNRRPPVYNTETPRKPHLDSPRNFAMFPLIYSSGPDRIPDIATDEGEPLYYYHPNPGPPRSAPAPNYIDPYFYFRDGTQVGAPYDKDSDGDDNSRDNIHNHDMGNLR